MNETERQVKLLEILMDAYVKLNQLHAQPGDKCHRLATSIQWLERQMKGLVA